MNLNISFHRKINQSLRGFLIKMEIKKLLQLSKEELIIIIQNKNSELRKLKEQLNGLINLSK